MGCQHSREAVMYSEPQYRCTTPETSYNAENVNQWQYVPKTEDISLDDPNIVRAIKLCGI